ncbi:MAG: outer membrane protein assembly factor BamB, partial [Mariniblastus sp.]
MLLCTRLTLVVGFILGAVEIGHAQQTVTQPSAVPAQSTSKQAESWGQWRGPRRDGTLKNVQLPDSLSEDVLKKSWATKLDASYSGALIVKDRVFVTESKNGEEVVTALDRKNGSVVWTHQWKGSMKVPFFAAANGSWIRSTPSYSDGKLYVAGMQDVLYCLDATNGQEVWSIDFPKKLGTSKPNFGFVCSPLVDSGFVYVQAGGGFTKLDKNTGDIVWQ